jgi:hypothetical protein
MPKLTAAQDLQNIIERLAVEHWTVSFRPHLTVCSLSVDPFPDVLDAAAAYIRECALLPLKVTRAVVTGAGFVQMQAPARHCCQPRACMAGVTGLVMPDSRRAFLQACSTANVEIGCPGRSPGNSHSFGQTVRQ